MLKFHENKYVVSLAGFNTICW